MTLAEDRYKYLEKDFPEFLKEIGLDIKGLKILDVGCNRGLHAYIMKERGADVYVNDLFMDNLIKHFEPEKKIKCAIGNLPEEYWGQFDVVTAFRILPFENPHSFYDGIAKALKPGGRVIVGMDDLPVIPLQEFLMNAHFKKNEVIYKNNRTFEENNFKVENPNIYIVSEPRYIEVKSGIDQNPSKKTQELLKSTLKNFTTDKNALDRLKNLKDFNFIMGERKIKNLAGQFLNISSRLLDIRDISKSSTLPASKHEMIYKSEVFWRLSNKLKDSGFTILTNTGLNKFIEESISQTELPTELEAKKEDIIKNIYTKVERETIKGKGTSIGGHKKGG